MSGEILLGSSMLARLKKDTGTKMFIKLWMARGHFYQNEVYYMDKRHIDFPMTFEEAVTYFVSEGQSTNDYTDTEKAAVATIGNKVDKVSGKGLSTNDYTDGEKAKLAALPTNDELETSLAGKQAAFTTSDELSMSAQNKLSLTDKAKMAPLIERAEACGVVYNRKTGYFSHNGIDDLTAAEVSDMLAHVNAVFIPKANCLSGLKARTNVVTKTTGDNGVAQLRLDGVCYANNRIMVLNVGPGLVSPESRIEAFARYCPILNTIIGELDFRYVTTIETSAFGYSPKLMEFRIKMLKTSLYLGDNPLLSLATLQYLVNNAANTKAITVTVHPTVYAKLTDESNAEWNAVLTAAEAKQIEFATTE